MSGKNSRDFRFKWDFIFLWILPLGNPSDLRWKRILSWVWQWWGKEESLGNKARVFSITKAYSPGRRLCQSQVLPKEGKGHVAQSIPLYPSYLNSGLPRWWCSSKEPACQSRRLRRYGFSPWVWKIPWRRAWQPIPVFLPGESHGQRGLTGYSPQGLRESDMTEHACKIQQCNLLFRSQLKKLNRTKFSNLYLLENDNNCMK